MTWGVVSWCRQATWPLSCDYPNFSASNILCPRTVELGIMSCKWNYSVKHGRAWGLSWWKHIIARLCLSRICSLNLSTVRHGRDNCYVMALPCGSSSSYPPPDSTWLPAKPIFQTVIFHPGICKVASEMHTTKGIFHYSGHYRVSLFWPWLNSYFS